MEHKDCYQGIKQIADNSIDLVVTDPPYKQQEGGGKFRNKRAYTKEIHTMVKGFDYQLLDELLRVMKKTNIYIFCSHDQVMDLLEYFVTQHGCKWDLITWHKTNPIPVCRNTYLHDTEYCLYFRDPEVKIYGEYHSKRTYYVTPVNKKDKKKYGHPTVKPLEIVKNFIYNSSQEGNLVLDPFSGSGTTGVASKLLKRDFQGYEINDTYYETAKQRIAETKIKADK